MSQAVTIAIAKTNVAEIGHVVEVALDEFSFGAVDNDYNLGQGDIEHGHFLQMVMKLQAELFQQKYETLN